MKKLFEKHDLIKISLIAIVVTLILTWIIPSGVYQAGEVQGVIQRTGLSDVTLGGMMSASFFLQQILFIIVVGAFYGAMTKIEGYKKLVTNLATKMKGHEIPFILVMSLLIAIYTSLSTNIFSAFVFIPFIISVIRKMKLDEMTAYTTTFGSMMIGVLGATYGTEGLISFVSYLQYYTDATVSVEIAVRAGILLLAYVLFNFFNVTHAKKVLTSKKDKKEETKEDIFATEEAKSKKAKTWPVAIGFIALLIFSILGFIDWQTNFEIEIFNTFHEWLTELAIKDHTIISYILGANAAAFGKWQLYHIILIMILVLILSAFIYREKFDSILEGMGNGIQKMMKPIAIVTLIYVIFVFMYWSPIVPTIVSWINGLAEGFNPFLSTLSAGISSLFHTDFGYTGYALGNLFASFEGKNFDIMYTIYVTMNGLVGFIAPTGVIAMMGLSYCNISYKKWIQYIWKFALGMLICLLVIFALLTYL